MATDTAQEKIKKLRGYYVDDESLDTLSDAEKELKKLIASSAIADHAVIRQIIAEDRKMVDGINFVLTNDETLSDADRAKLFERRKAFIFHLNRFGGEDTKKRAASIEKFLDDKLAEVGLE